MPTTGHTARTCERCRRFSTTGTGRCRSSTRGSPGAARPSGRYGVPEDRADDGWERSAAVRYLPEADQAALRGDVGEVFYLMARVAYQQAAGASDPAARAEYAGGPDAGTSPRRTRGDRLPLSLLVQRIDVARLKGSADEERAAREQAWGTRPGRLATTT